MHQHYSLPEPLTPARFYILLALARSELHGYAIRGAINSLSLGSVEPKSGTLYPLLSRMFDEGLIELTSTKAFGSLDRKRSYYGITVHGLRTLKADFTRLQYALVAGENLGLLNQNET